MGNRHYLFYQKYYEALANVNNPDYKAINRELTGSSVLEAGSGFKTPDEFVLETMYPGLLAGLGYPHDIKKDSAGEGDTADDAIRLGFSFDYVTGLPVIPGSTVKGVLRNAFKRGYTYIADKLKDCGVSDKDTARVLEYAIFGEPVDDEEENGAVAAPIGSRDVFLDAFPTQTSDGKLLGIENITPHSRPDDGDYKGLKAPQPLKLLKVKPGVQFTFRFIIKANEFDFNGKNITVCAKTKRELYKNIIVDLGIGAKTNTGFGYMKAPEVPLQEPGQGVIAQRQVQTVVTHMPVEGVCIKCGGKTGLNVKTGTYYEYCSKCSQAGRKG